MNLLETANLQFGECVQPLRFLIQVVRDLLTTHFLPVDLSTLVNEYLFDTNGSLSKPFWERCNGVDGQCRWTWIYSVPRDVAIDIIRQVAILCDANILEVAKTILHIGAYRVTDQKPKVNVVVHWDYTLGEVPQFVYKCALEYAIEKHPWFDPMNSQLLFARHQFVTVINSQVCFLHLSMDLNDPERQHPAFGKALKHRFAVHLAHFQTTLFTHIESILNQSPVL